MTRRVFVHVGSPTAGARHLADTLARNRRRLTRHGVLFPAGHVGHDGGHEAAVLDVLGLTAPGRAAAPGTWDRLAEAARDWRRGTVLLSHEALADATAPQAERITDSFGDAEVHVLHVARPLGRQIPLAWQSWVHAGGRVGYAGYLQHVLAGDAHRIGQAFWHAHDPAGVLGRWADLVPAHRLHLLTLPDGGDPGAVLWRRFAGTVGLDPAGFRVGPDTSARPAGLVETEVLRLLNVQTGQRATPEALAGLAATVARHGVPGPAPAVPAQHRDRLEQACDELTARVRGAGYDVVGSLADLRPHDGLFSASEDRLHPPATEVIAAQSRLVADLAGLETRPGRRRRQLGRPRLSPPGRLRRPPHR